MTASPAFCTSVPLGMGTMRTRLKAFNCNAHSVSVSSSDYNTCHLLDSSTRYSCPARACAKRTPPSPPSHASSRRHFLLSLISTALSLAATSNDSSTPVFASENDTTSTTTTTTTTSTADSQPESHSSVSIENSPFIVTPKVVNTDSSGLKQTDTGIAFIDFAEGDGRTPNWGDLIVMQYIMYTIDPKTNELIKQTSSYDGYDKGYLMHHGNGEHLIGLEQMLHTMSEGGKRRFILPQRLHFYQAGFAPVPRSSFGRRKLTKALANSNGLLVMDVEVVRIMKDPNDRGYYDDLNLDDEQLKELIKRLPRETPPPGATAFYF